MPRTQTTANARAAEYWSQVAPSWLEFEHELETISERPGQLAMNRLDLEPGHTVVDLGCGSGLTTVQLAERVGEAGSALGVDLSAELLGEARRRADRHGAGNVEFLAADIQTDHLGEARFDRAYSRFGLMFCADPPAAFANLRHALRPGGRLSFVCFQSAAENEWMLVPTAAALAVTGAAPAAPDPQQPDLFSLADADHLRSILAAAGFHDIDIHAHNDAVVTREPDIPRIVAARTHIGPVAELLRTAAADTTARVHEAITAALRARLHEDSLRLTRGTLLVAATA
jgi:ubiquinone/menaquinone biosynthesis C-methylase UbiE